MYISYISIFIEFRCLRVRPELYLSFVFAIVFAIFATRDSRINIFFFIKIANSVIQRIILPAYLYHYCLSKLCEFRVEFFHIRIKMTETIDSILYTQAIKLYEYKYFAFGKRIQKNLPMKYEIKSKMANSIL